MAQNSLFAILLRSPWWASFGIAALIALVSMAALPDRYVIFGVIGGWPFLAIGLIVAWRQLRAPGAARVAELQERLSAMSWRTFSELVEHAFRQDGYTVSRVNGPDADFAVSKAGKTALVSCKRWKAAGSGVEPLRDLHAALQTHQAQDGMYFTTGTLSDTARRFAADNSIRIVQGADLARLLLTMQHNKPLPA
jgi:restriction system protein